MSAAPPPYPGTGKGPGRLTFKYVPAKQFWLHACYNKIMYTVHLIRRILFTEFAIAKKQVAHWHNGIIDARSRYLEKSQILVV